MGFSFSKGTTWLKSFSSGGCLCQAEGLSDFLLSGAQLASNPSQVTVRTVRCQFYDFALQYHLF